MPALLAENHKAAEGTLARRRSAAVVVRCVALVAFGLGLILIFRNVVTPIRVTGISMEPNYRDGRINFVNRLSYRTEAPKRGDVVAIRGSTNSHFSFVYLKRIVALPGEAATITNGVLLINGQPLKEPYVIQRSPWNVPLTLLKQNEYLVIGDNRAMEESCQLFGRVDQTNILGKVLW
jgi:signal peptidase I